MFNADEISMQVVNQVLHHMQWQYLNQLFFAAPDVVSTPGQPHPIKQSPLREQITTLCRVANGEIDRGTVDDLFAGTVIEMTQSLAETLFSTPGANGYTIPDSFWSTDLGQAIVLAQLWARGDELITMSEAAQILRGDTADRDLVYINSLVKSGKLTRYTDPVETNPQHAGRVSRDQVEGLKGEHEDCP